MTDAISPAPARSKLFSALIGLVSLDIVLQGVWAGIFIREGKDNNDHWVSIHAHGADIAIVIAIAALIVALGLMGLAVWLPLRSRQG